MQLKNLTFFGSTFGLIIMGDPVAKHKVESNTGVGTGMDRCIHIHTQLGCDDKYRNSG